MVTTALDIGCAAIKMYEHEELSINNDDAYDVFFDAIHKG
nr:hypothetical protein [Tanacetum cinerariifolium]